MNPARLKIIDILLGIVTYELQHDKDGFLLSQECDRWVEAHPIAARVAIASIGAMIVLHLANLLPPEYDPLHKGLWKEIRERVFA